MAEENEAENIELSDYVEATTTLELSAEWAEYLFSEAIPGNVEGADDGLDDRGDAAMA
ncbi:MAG: hypothetical protein ABI862_03210 [Ilumatobacteraceae bacterium]